MIKRVKLAAAIFVGSFLAAASAPAVGQASLDVTAQQSSKQPVQYTRQPVGGGCRIDRMPALPAGANQAPPAARSGFVWELGTYRCRNNRWEYIPGHWERARANARQNPLAAIEVRQGSVFARPGFEIVQTGTGPNAETIVRRRATGPAGGAFAGFTGTFNCGCAAETPGTCQLKGFNGGLRCDNGTCTDCFMTYTIDAPRATGITMRRFIIPGLSCGQSGGESAALR